MKTVVKIIALVSAGLVLFGLGGLTIIEKNWFGVVLLLFGLWILFSIKIIGPEEMAVFVLLGDPIGFRNSGPCFVPLFLAKLKRFPKKVYNFSYPGREIITSEGEYEERQYGAQVVIVDSVAYIRFPQNENLIEILQAQVPIDDKELEDWTEESVVGALRVAIGQITWKEATEKLREIVIKADEVFKAEDGALLRVGFQKNDIKLTIKEIKLPSELKKVLPRVDKERLEAEAAPYEAEERAEETMGFLIKMLAKALGKPINKIQEEIEYSPDLKREIRIFSKELVRDEMALKGNSLLRIITPQGTTLESLIALWRGIPMGRKPVEEEKSEEEKSETERVREADLRPERSFEVAKELAAEREKKKKEEKRKTK